MHKRLGIFGGTFDPIHIGHLLVAEIARQECDLEKVLFIPAYSPPHKKDNPISPSNYRFEMIKLAVAGNPYFEVSDAEINRKGVSYTIDTLRTLKEIYSEDYELWMIIGGDSFLEIDMWKEANELVKMCNFAVYGRPGYPPEDFRVQIEKLNNHGDMTGVLLNAPMMGISSTDIRYRVAQGKSIRYMVSDSVKEFIRKKKLFLD